jgi:sterol desaturase/sphingolipid hydroxylase (fatty acid hydroxylase superfamily)
MTDGHSWFRYIPVIVAGLFLLFFAVEKRFPLRKSRSRLIARLFVNASISVLAFMVAALIVRPSALRALNWTSEKSFGLVHLVPLPPWARFLLAFVLLDLSFYYWHQLNHRAPFLWRFHIVHHLDPTLDVSTAFRFHFGEVLLSTLFRLVQVSVIGASFTSFAVYELLFQSNTMFHHSNLRLPIGMERWLNRVLVTPRMHGIHHSQVRPETHSNYGVVFSCWDRLHKTLGLNIPQAKIEIGIAGYTLPRDNRIWHMILLPFIKQRDYWRTPEGSLPQRDTADLQGTPNCLAE